MPHARGPEIPNVEQPIAVFDSGVGGLTVLNALLSALPDERFVYLGDTARVPYGSKPLSMVRDFAYEISQALVALPAKAVVVACNTASAAALPQLAADLDVPVWGVVEPGVEAALRATESGERVAVLGTAATVSARVYQDRLEAADRQVWAQACPLFVPIVEEGISDSEIARLVAGHYLARRPRLDAVILACTHYPLLKPVLGELLGDAVRLIDSSQAVAERVARDLAAIGLTRPPQRPETRASGTDGSHSAAAPRAAAAGRVGYLVTGDVAAFAHTGSRLGWLEGPAAHVDLANHGEAPPIELANALPGLGRPA